MNADVGGSLLKNQTFGQVEKKVDKKEIDVKAALHEDMEMPEGAVSCKVKRYIKTVGKVRTTRVIKTFIMGDGTTQTLEEVDEEFII